MVGLDPSIATAENYRRFARLEAAGRSPAYEALANAVAGDEMVLAFLGSLVAAKRQPNMLFAAARYLLGAPPGPHSLHALVAERPSELAQVMNNQRTQTNEAARCAVLLPALAALPQPLALLEVGAAAGLTLLPDMYSYDYDGHRITGLDPQAPTLTCRPRGLVPLPATVPEVAWRAGIDLNPLDVSDEADVAWLSCLIWPGEEGRVERLHAAAGAARRHLPVLHQGDLLDDLPNVAARAPSEATLVVYHTAVLAYVDEDKRRALPRRWRTSAPCGCPTRRRGFCRISTSTSAPGPSCLSGMAATSSLAPTRTGHGSSGRTMLLPGRRWACGTRSGDQIEPALRPAGPRQLAVACDQGTIEALGQGDICSVVGGEVLAQLPDALQQRRERHAPDRETRQVPQSAGHGRSQGGVRSAQSAQRGDDLGV